MVGLCIFAKIHKFDGRVTPNALNSTDFRFSLLWVYILGYDNMNISLLGTGWLGLPLAKTLISQGYKVRGSTRTKERDTELRATNIIPCILDLKESNQDWHEFLDSNVLIVNIPSKEICGFEHLIARIQSSNIQKVIFISSTSVYSNINQVIYEDEKLENNGHPLRKIEQLFMNNTHFQTSVIRFGGLIGYSRHPGRFFKPNSVVKNPDAKVNLIHRDDCIKIIVRILELDLWGEEFNCCADSHPTKRDFYRQAALQCGIEVPNFEQNNDLRFKIISNQKVKKLLEYEFKYSDLMDILF